MTPDDVSPDIGTLFGLDGKVALVTGGSRGIGLMIAHGLVTAGCRVYISSRKADACAAAVEELEARGGTAVALPTDLSGEDEARALAEELDRREEWMDILVNNAGATWGAPLEDFPDAAVDKVFAINVKAPFHLTRFLLPLLREAATDDDPARVINVGSVDGIRPPVMENYPYAASKAAVHMLTRQLAQHLAGERITVNAIAPGPFESKMMAFALEDEGARAAIASGVPLGRIGRPDDVGGTAVFLASRAGSYLTGAVIPVDGGLSVG